MEGPTGHVPVLLREVVGLLAPAGRRVIVDCTVGLGGHSEALLSQAGGQSRLIGLDVDEANLVLARSRLNPFGDRVRLFQANFTELPEVLAQAGVDRVDALLADLGVASTQLDDPERGLSFLADGPLDMRMDPRRTTTAADLVNRLGEAELADLIYNFSDERFSRRIARAIVEARRSGPFRRTGQLATVVAGAYPRAVWATRTGVHPATRTFQALRIAVNEELACLDTLLALIPEVLAVGGRAGVISFHSLEDRRVKRAFADLAASGQAEGLTKKPLTAGDEERQTNPRSRSAKLRGIERRNPT
ncbi:MAG: 16S rRNA (cytosine(1402)-N(4))-methyltransferase RsmH [Planctomycetota bacterium]|nr:16S rRNA (cytosine(1402)-N(4))-methyltransferase RsmH [Planctomycetota bacterium]